jgi:hypothetical protein
VDQPGRREYQINKNQQHEEIQKSDYTGNPYVNLDFPETSYYVSGG